MSRDVRAIVFGRQGIEEVAAALNAGGLATEIERIPPGTHDDLMAGRIVFKDARRDNEDNRVLWIFKGEIGDDLDVYSGERTLLSMGHDHDGVGLLRSVVEAFGGFLSQDAGNAEWESVETVGLTFTPQEEFRIAMSKIMTPKQAEILFAIADDADKRQTVVEAFEAYGSAARLGMKGP